MPNLSYTMFTNTLGDLSDCEDKLDDICGDFDVLSDSEAIAARKLVSMCARIADTYLDSGYSNE